MIPNNGSVWKARDGRIMRVEFTVRPLDGGVVWCSMAVLNPGKGQRSRTTMSTNEFGTSPKAFMQPHDEK